MKKANVIAGALFLSAAISGAIFVAGSLGAGAQTTAVSCSPSAVATAPLQAVTLTASGGNGTYTWSSPGLNVTNPTGTNFVVSFNADGTYPVTVTSASSSATCTVNVTGAAAGGTTGSTTGATTGTTGTTTPGLPNTGAMPE